MPYFVHAEGTAPETGESFHVRSEAHSESSRRETKHIVSFVISDDECREWRAREYRRFQDQEYQLPPWIESLLKLWEPSDAPDQDYFEWRPVALHFTHLSLKTPGCIAYTPSDEHGFQDRQVTVKVGKYLTEHLSSVFSEAQIADYVARVKSYTADLQLATSAKDICDVYVNGPHSCMSDRKSEYEAHGHHPSEVFGDSDLALAYLGTISNPSARCLVWPDKKLFCRNYGDSALLEVLKANGFTREMDGSSYGQFDGAKIKAIKLGRDHYVMPYLDCANGLTLDRDGKHFTLHSDGGDSDYATDSTNGTTGGRPVHHCEHCNEECDEDETYCSSCEDDRISCERCDYESFDSSNGEYLDDIWFCDACVSDHFTHSCQNGDCDRTWTEREPESQYCSRCKPHMKPCEDCDEDHDTRSSNDPDSHKCDDCYKGDEDDTEERSDTTEEIADTSAPVVTSSQVMPTRADLLLYPVIEDKITVLFNMNPRDGRIVDVLYLSGAFAVHRKAEDSNYPAYTVTHIPSGLCASRKATYEEAIALADLLATPGINWAFIRSDDAPTSTREIAQFIVHNNALPPADSFAGMMLHDLTTRHQLTEDDPCTL